VNRRRLVRVPASSANLGPGFDAFACALSVHMELEGVRYVEEALAPHPAAAQLPAG